MSGLFVRWMKEDKRIGDRVSTEFVEIELCNESLTENPGGITGLLKDLMSDTIVSKMRESESQTSSAAAKDCENCVRGI